MLQNSLEMDRLPDSISNVQCSSSGITDVVIHCSFKLAPKDESDLLSGLKFKRIDHMGQHEVAECVPFNASVVYYHNPNNRGHIQLFLSEDKTMGCVDVYIE